MWQVVSEGEFASNFSGRCAVGGVDTNIRSFTHNTCEVEIVSKSEPYLFKHRGRNIYVLIITYLWYASPGGATGASTKQI